MASAPMGWVMSARNKFRSALPSVYGPRGMIMLGLALLSAGFGLAYVGIFTIPPMPGLALVQIIMPMPLWGVAWFLSAFTLVGAAFKVDQSKALGGVTGLLAVWTLSYVSYFVQTPELPNGSPNLSWLTALVFFAMVVLLMGVARMLNHAPSHAAIVEKPGAVSEPQ